MIHHLWIFTTNIVNPRNPNSREASWISLILIILRLILTSSVHKIDNKFYKLTNSSGLQLQVNQLKI
jgi:hypothetical protein